MSFTSDSQIRSGTVDANRRSLREKWGTTVIEEGWTPIPIRLLEHQKTLGIRPSEMSVVIHLLRYWFSADQEYVFPRQSKIAESSGMSVRTVQRAIDSLEDKGLIEKEKKKEGFSTYAHNYYSLQPLVKKVQGLPPVPTRKK